MGKIKNNISSLKNEIAHSQVKIIAVTKYSDINEIIQAYDSGLNCFGENRVQDAIEKFSKLPLIIRENSQFHLLGHLQSNKAKKAVEHFDVIQSVDSLKIAERISNIASEINKIQKVFLQVNFSKEESKFGFYVEDLLNNFPKLLKMQNLKIEGLMTIAVKNSSKTELITLFNGVKNLQSELNLKYNLNMLELSMGMSDDYKEAIECGSTLIRIGRKIFKD